MSAQFAGVCCLWGLTERPTVAVASPYSLVSRPKLLPYTRVPFSLSPRPFLPFFPPPPSVRSFHPAPPPPPPPRFSARVKGDICGASPSANSSLIGHVQVLARDVGKYGKRNGLSLVAKCMRVPENLG